MSLSEAAGAEGWVCDDGKAAVAAESHGWLKYSGDDLRVGPTTMVGHSLPMDGFVLGIEAADGSLDERYFSEDRIAEAWTSGSRYALDLDLKRGDTVYVRFDQSLGTMDAKEIGFQDPEFAETLRTASLILLGIILGILGLTVATSTLLAVAIRRPYAWLHASYSTLLTIYVACSGSVVFVAFPWLSLWDRATVTYASLAWAIALLGPFALDFFRRAELGRGLRGAIMGSAGLAFLAGFLLPLSALLDVNLRTLYNAAFLPGMVTTIIVTAVAWRRGNENAKVFALAWAMPFLFGAERVIRNLDLYTLPPITDFGFHIALAIEASMLTLIIGWQIERMRKERDSALAERAILEAESRLDPLTGLRNRRDYDRRVWNRGEVLGLIDLDHFKQVNDRYGHETGDAVLKVVASVLKQGVRDGRLSGAWRLGGEEFAVIIPSDGRAMAEVEINTLRNRIPIAIDNSIPGLENTVTASAGLAEVGSNSNLATFRQADRMLYAAKKLGRDRLCFKTAEAAASERKATETANEPDDQLSRSRNVA
ncbi:GGDEF domain-containing protein [Qipengyuania xiapuensis]|uniref:diguanylate cyclase n=1 Tax=Qipengyuania xiapuensis TaxID=2867236 RepID=A0ABX8ZTP7_9SPHN|nr:diguanylate cyclase [Qipengyuania xiapuensis]QZD92365.1 GGDEF domain-containing protein [Qipengyuania xiapuensis]